MFSLILISCQTSKVVKEESKPVVKTPVVDETPVKTNKIQFTELEQHILEELPNLESHWTRSDVESHLLLNSQFMGMITSEGSRENFTYYYELKNYQLVLHFDYSQHKDGLFQASEVLNKKGELMFFGML